MPYGSGSYGIYGFGAWPRVYGSGSIPGGYGAGGAYGGSGSYGGAPGFLIVAYNSIWSYGSIEYGESFSSGLPAGNVSTFIDALLAVSDLISPGEYGTTEYGGGVVTPFAVTQKFVFSTIDALLYSPDRTTISFLVGSVRDQITAPQFIRSRAKHLGARESYKMNLEIAQMIFDLKYLAQKYDSLATILNIYIANIQQGFSLPEGIVYHRLAPVPKLMIGEDIVIIPETSHTEDIQEEQNIENILADAGSIEGFIDGTEDLAIRLLKLRDRVNQLEVVSKPLHGSLPEEPIMITGDTIIIT